jgi:predicted RNA-binding Zn-ribbon protein involved in translation (DUF1610 family)
MFKKRQKSQKALEIIKAPRIITCPSCGWAGIKAELVIKVVEPDINDRIANSFYTFALASPPTEKVQYKCPRCNEMIASDMHYYSSYFDENSFLD